MFSGGQALNLVDGRVYLDRNPKIFKLMIDFFRDGKEITDFKNDQEKELYLAELEFWNI